MTEDLPLPDLPGETPPGVEATVSPPTDLNQEERSQKECTREEKEDSVPQDRTETVSISGTTPSVARPRLPTAAKKCPRKEFRGTAAQVAKTKEPFKKSKCLTALQEIRKLQTSFQDLIPFAPFARLVRELCSELVEMRFTKEAIQALRSAGEAYLLEVL